MVCASFLITNFRYQAFNKNLPFSDLKEYEKIKRYFLKSQMLISQRIFNF